MYPHDYLFILEGHKVVRCSDVNRWNELLSDGDARRVALTNIDMDVEVSTVFLGIHVLPNRVPMVFETMVFGGACDNMQVRYPTWIDAEEGHKIIVQEILSKKKLLKET